jgi:hypothetical protein
MRLGAPTFPSAAAPTPGRLRLVTVDAELEPAGRSLDARRRDRRETRLRGGVERGVAELIDHAGQPPRVRGHTVHRVGREHVIEAQPLALEPARHVGADIRGIEGPEADAEREGRLPVLLLETRELDVQARLADEQDREPPLARALGFGEVANEPQLRQGQALRVVDGNDRRALRTDAGSKGREERRAPRRRCGGAARAWLSVRRQEHLVRGPERACPQHADRVVLQVARDALQDRRLPGSWLAQ